MDHDETTRNHSPNVPETEADRLSRRQFLTTAGMIGVGLAVAGRAGAQGGNASGDAMPGDPMSAGQQGGQQGGSRHLLHRPALRTAALARTPARPRAHSGTRPRGRPLPKPCWKDQRQARARFPSGLWARPA